MSFTQRSMAARCGFPRLSVTRMTRSMFSISSRSVANVRSDKRTPKSRASARASPSPPTSALKRCRKSSVSGGDKAGSSSMVSAMRHSRYALVTGFASAVGSCGIVSAKVRDTCGSIWSWYSQSELTESMRPVSRKPSKIAPSQRAADDANLQHRCAALAQAGSRGINFGKCPPNL